MNCPKCAKETKHQHKHQAAHGLAGTHMSGSEVYECDECKYKMYKSEGEQQGLEFVLD